MLSPILLLAPAVVAAATPALFARACGDNCARAVIASAFTTRHGAEDCAAYLKTTVTPATSTVTQTITLSFTPTVVDHVTLTTLVTTTVDDEVTQTEHKTMIETVATVTTTIAAVQPIDKRLIVSNPNTIPAYASACSGEARYMTACACVGVFPTTITAAAPSTTQTIYVSVTSATTTVTTTASTETQVLTETSTITKVVTTTDVTVDVTATATATAAAAPVGNFRLQGAGPSFTGFYITYSEMINDESHGYWAELGLSRLTDNSVVAALNGTSLAMINAPQPVSLYAHNDGLNGVYPVYFMDPRSSSFFRSITGGSNYSPVDCSITANIITCAGSWAPDYNIFVKKLSTGEICLATSDNVANYADLQEIRLGLAPV